ncbi:hypothetical protein [Streptomyces lanatus]|uniref:Uncharacterized protein n=1 Tax=Streptomyces lanatus TaxID=66900 RepID=A0ABV1XR77_9ACTN|nr:hypothetical protein [Streptomyces lanatus]
MTLRVASSTSFRCSCSKRGMPTFPLYCGAIAPEKAEGHDDFIRVFQRGEQRVGVVGGAGREVADEGAALGGHADPCVRDPDLVDGAGVHHYLGGDVLGLVVVDGAEDHGGAGPAFAGLGEGSEALPDESAAGLQIFDQGDRLVPPVLFRRQELPGSGEGEEPVVIPCLEGLVGGIDVVRSGRRVVQDDTHPVAGAHEVVPLDAEPALAEAAHTVVAEAGDGYLVVVEIVRAGARQDVHRVQDDAVDAAVQYLGDHLGDDLLRDPVRDADLVAGGVVLVPDEQILRGRETEVQQHPPPDHSVGAEFVPCVGDPLGQRVAAAEGRLWGLDHGLEGRSRPHDGREADLRRGPAGVLTVSVDPVAHVRVLQHHRGGDVEDIAFAGFGVVDFFPRGALIGFVVHVPPPCSILLIRIT